MLYCYIFILLSELLVPVVIHIVRVKVWVVQHSLYER